MTGGPETTPAATILMFLVLDPHLSLMVDDVAGRRRDESRFRRSVVVLTGTRLVGTVVAQALLVPAAIGVAMVAEHL